MVVDHVPEFAGEKGVEVCAEVEALETGGFVGF